VKSYRWKGPVFAISAVNGEGCRELTFAIQAWLDAHPSYATAAVDGDEAAAAPLVVTPAPVRARRRRSQEDAP